MICEKCRKILPYIKEPRCLKCGKPILKMEQEYCYDCSKKEHFFEQGRSLWIHREPVNRAVYAFKYHSLMCYGIVFGREMGKQMAEYLLENEVELLIPIPLHRRKQRERGYNQSAVLAKEISEHTGIPAEERLLIRRKYTKPQKQLNDVERIKNIKGAFALAGEIKAENVALIDDIYTTGSTIDEAAEVLRNSGVSKVYFLTISIGQGF